MEPGYRACPYCAEPIREEAKLCRFCNRDVQKGTSPGQMTPQTRKASVLTSSTITIGRAFWKLFFWSVVAIGVSFVVLIIVGNRSDTSKSSLDFHITTPVAQNVYSGQLKVAAIQCRYWNLTITPTMLNAHLIGSFQASGGLGNDIEVLIAEQAEFQNWLNGHPARTLYSSGKVTAGKIDVPLSSGSYVLAFNNKFSLLSAKQVTVDISIQYF